MNIARNPGGVQVPGSLQMNPTGPPALFQPSRDLNNSQEVDKMKIRNFEKYVFRNFSYTFACPDLGIKFLYQFFALNPNLRSKMQNSELQGRKNEN